METGTPTRPPVGAPSLERGRPASVGRAHQPLGGGLGRDSLETNGWLAGSQTFAQGVARATALAGTLGSHHKAVLVAAAVLEGDRLTIARGVDRAISGVTTLATRLAPGHAAAIARVADPALRGTGWVLRGVGRAAPFLNVLAASWDTYKAATTPAGPERPVAWVKAGLSVASTVLAVGAAVVGATPIGWAGAIGAAAVAGFQLADALCLQGRWTQAIADAFVGGRAASHDGARAGDVQEKALAPSPASRAL